MRALDGEDTSPDALPAPDDVKSAFSVVVPLLLDSRFTGMRHQLPRRLNTTPAVRACTSRRRSGCVI